MLANEYVVIGYFLVFLLGCGVGSLIVGNDEYKAGFKEGRLQGQVDYLEQYQYPEDATYAGIQLSYSNKDEGFRNVVREDLDEELRGADNPRSNSR